MAMTARPSPLLLLLLLLALAGARTASLSVTSTPLSPPADILGEHQELQRAWTVSDVGPLRDLRLLRLPGAVYVDVAPEEPTGGDDGNADRDGSGSGSGSGWSGSSGSAEAAGSLNASSTAAPSDSPSPSTAERVVARVVVSGSSAALMRGVELAAREDAGVALTLALTADAARHEGHLLTQISVSDRRALEGLRVEAAGAAPVVVVVGAGVMPADGAGGRRPIEVRASSAGNASLFLDDARGAAASALDVSATSRASVQVLARGPLALAAALDLASFGSGDIAVVAPAVRAARVVATVGGSGDVFVQTAAAKEGEAEAEVEVEEEEGGEEDRGGIEATHIDARVAGSGSVTLSRAGRCEQLDVVLLGSGDVRAGSVRCERAAVTLVGSGEAVVRADKELRATVFASGRVAYAGRRPAAVVERGLFFGRPKVERAAGGEAAYPVYQPRPEPPTRAAALVHGDRDGGDGGEADAAVEAAAVAYSALSKRGSGGQLLAELAAGGAAVAVALAAVAAYRQRQRRHQYTRLV